MLHLPPRVTLIVGEMSRGVQARLKLSFQCFFHHFTKSPERKPVQDFSCANICYVTLTFSTSTTTRDSPVTRASENDSLFIRISDANGIY